MLDGLELTNGFSEDISKLNKTNYLKTLKNLKIQSDDTYYIIDINNEALNLLDCTSILLEENQNPEKVSIKLYIYKNTGLMGKIKFLYDDEIQQESNYTYEFNNVTDDIFIEPDISEYEILQQ